MMESGVGLRAARPRKEFCRFLDLRAGWNCLPKEAAVPGCGQCFTEVGLLGRTFGQTLRCDRRGQLTTWISEALIVNCMTAFCWTARARGSRRSAGGPNEAKIRAGQSKSTPMHSLLWHLQAYAWSLVFESRFGQRFFVWGEWWAFPSAGQPTTTMHKPPKEALLAAPAELR